MKLRIKKNGNPIQLAAGFFTIRVGENFEYRLSCKKNYLRVRYFEKGRDGSLLKGELTFQRVADSAKCDKIKATIKDWKLHGPESLEVLGEKFYVYRSEQYKEYCRVDVHSLEKDEKRQTCDVQFYKRM